MQLRHSGELTAATTPSNTAQPQVKMGPRVPSLTMCHHARVGSPSGEQVESALYPPFLASGQPRAGEAHREPWVPPSRPRVPRGAECFTLNWPS